MNMNMQEHINDLIEYNRLVIKLEDELKKNLQKMQLYQNKIWT